MSDQLHMLRRGSEGSKDKFGDGPPNKKINQTTFAKWLPSLLILAFLLLAWLLFGDRFERAREVELVKVVTMRASVEPREDVVAEVDDSALNFDGATLFQASGWVESDPLPIRVTTLYSGVVEEVLVLQGEKVASGQLLARMVDDDARLDLNTAAASLAQVKAELVQKQSMVAAADAALASVAKQIASAEARFAELEDQADRLEKAGNEVFRENEITQARLRADAQMASVEGLRARKLELQARLKQAKAAVLVAEARITSVEVEVARKQLALDRTEIRSPIDGRVQKLYAAPGMKRMLNMDGLETGTIAKVFSPESLQARIDVPLEEAAQLRLGQAVRLRSSLLPDQVFEGRVSRIDGQADLQRNTLQAKVKLLDPDELLRPEMLCRAEFLEGGAASSASVAKASARVSVYVPESALIESGANQKVWALDGGGQRIESREVRVSQDSRDGFVRVTQGLRPGEFIVNNPPTDLKVGERVKKEGN